MGLVLQKQPLNCSSMKKSFIIILILLVAGLVQAQTSWYVSTTGVNAAGNGSFASPFRTITYASPFLTAGDTLFVRGGTYYNANYGNGDYWKQEQTARISGRNGAPGQYIVIMPYNNEQVILKCDGQFALQVQSSSYVKVQGFEVYGETENIALSLALDYQFAFRRNANTPATLIEYRVPPGTTTFQTGLEDLSPYTIYRPFYFFTHGIVVQGSDHVEVTNNLVHHMPGEGIRFAGSDYVTASDNIVYNNARRSSTGVHGISCYTLQSIDLNDNVKVLFARNLVYDNYCEMASWSEQKTEFNPAIDEGKGLTVQRTYTANGWLHGRIRFENNVAYGNGLSGIHVNSGDRIDIVNNTLYQNNRYGTGNNLGISLQNADDATVYNNIVVSDLSWGGYTISQSSATTNVTVANNLVNGGLHPDIDALDANTIFGSPLFVNSAANNFSLSAASPAINTAHKPVAPDNDFEGMLRDAFPDRGALEYFAALPLQRLHFAATGKGNEVLLQWTTTGEVNTAYFEVQHSAGGIQWNKTGTVTAKGYTSFEQQYNFKHAAPATGINYYRLKLVDKDGKFSWSSVCTVNFSGEAQILVYPNPFTKSVMLKGVNNLQKVQLFTIAGIDVTGAAVISRQLSQIKIETAALSPGNYILLINNQSFIITKSE